MEKYRNFKIIKGIKKEEERSIKDKKEQRKREIKKKKIVKKMLKGSDRGRYIYMFKNRINILNMGEYYICNKINKKF